MPRKTTKQIRSHVAQPSAALSSSETSTRRRRLLLIPSSKVRILHGPFRVALLRANRFVTRIGHARAVSEAHGVPLPVPHEVDPGERPSREGGRPGQRCWRTSRTRPGKRLDLVVAEVVYVLEFVYEVER